MDPREGSFNERLCSTACQLKYQGVTGSLFQWATLLDSLSTKKIFVISVVQFQWATLLDSLSTFLLSYPSKNQKFQWATLLDSLSTVVIQYFGQTQKFQWATLLDSLSTLCFSSLIMATNVSMSDFARQPVNARNTPTAKISVSMSDFARQPVNLLNGEELRNSVSMSDFARQPVNCHCFG